MLCWAIRWLIDRHLAGRQSLPGLARRHVERCPRCTRYRAASQELIEQLAGAADAELPVPGPLRARIMAAISCAQAAGPRMSVPRTRSRRLIHLAAAAGLLAAAWGALVLLPTEHAAERPTTPMVEHAPGPADIPPIQPEVLLQRSSMALEQFADQAIRQEFSAINDDIQSLGQILLASLPLDMVVLDSNGEDAGPD